MDVDNPFREGLDERLRNFPQETRQHNQVDVKALHLFDEGIAIEVLLGNHPQRNAQVLGAFDRISLRVVAHHIDDFNIRVVGEILGNALQVGAVAADEYG